MLRPKKGQRFKNKNQLQSAKYKDEMLISAMKSFPAELWKIKSKESKPSLKPKFTMKRYRDETLIVFKNDYMEYVASFLCLIY